LVEAVHDSVKGRARYRVEGLYRSDELKEYLEEGLPKKAGISFASASILTGNVLVLYAPEFEPSHVAAQISELLAERRHNGTVTAPGPHQKTPARRHNRTPRHAGCIAAERKKTDHPWGAAGP
jgi:hypothetical protein